MTVQKLENDSSFWSRVGLGGIARVHRGLLCIRSWGCGLGPHFIFAGKGLAAGVVGN